MSSKTILSITEAAKVLGIERSTFYRHIDEKGISLIKRDGSHPKVDVSELIRVYGEQVKPERLNDNNETKSNKNATKKDTEQNDNNPDIEEKLKILEQERSRERKQFEDQVEHLRDMLKSEQEERRKITALITDQSKKSEKSDDWQRAMTALEKRIANQEKAAKEREEREQKLLDENRRIKQAYSKQKKALEEEKSKSFFKKLFG